MQPESPILWLHMFKEASVTEVLQWLFLGSGTVLAGILYRNSHREGRPTRLWGFLLAGLLIMFLRIQSISGTGWRGYLPWLSSVPTPTPMPGGLRQRRIFLS